MQQQRLRGRLLIFRASHGPDALGIIGREGDRQQKDAIAFRQMRQVVDQLTAVGTARRGENDDLVATFTEDERGVAIP